MDVTTLTARILFLVSVKEKLPLVTLVIVLSFVVYLLCEKKWKQNRLGSDSVVFPFTRYHWRDCESFEKNVPLRDTEVTSNELTVNAVDSLNCSKRVLAWMVMLNPSSLVCITILWRANKALTGIEVSYRASLLLLQNFPHKIFSFGLMFWN